MELNQEQIARLRVSPWAPGRCQKTTRVVRAMHPGVIVLGEIPTTETPFRCFMASGHSGPCAAWGPDGAPWLFHEQGA